MFKKDKKIFHLEEESVRRERKEKRFLWISFAVIVAVSAAAVFFVLKKNDFKLNYFFDPSSKTTAPESSTTPADVTPVVPVVSGKTNFLVLGTDETNKTLEFVLLVQCDLDAKNFKACALPPSLAASVGSRADSLQGQLTYGGPTQAVQAVSSLIGQPVHRYVQVRSDRFVTIGRKLGTISYNVPESIQYTGADFDLKLSAGEQSLTPETVLKLARYPFGGNLQKQMSVQNGLAVNALDQLLSKDNVAKADKLFSDIVNLIDTNISVADFTRSKDALIALSQGTGRKASEGISAGGSVQNGRYVLDASSVAVLKERFAAAQKD